MRICAVPSGWRGNGRTVARPRTNHQFVREIADTPASDCICGTSAAELAFSPQRAAPALSRKYRCGCLPAVAADGVRAQARAAAGRGR
jgi:hypothetical protein